MIGLFKLRNMTNLPFKVAIAIYLYTLVYLIHNISDARAYIVMG